MLCRLRLSEKKIIMTCSNTLVVFGMKIMDQTSLLLCAKGKVKNNCINIVILMNILEYHLHSKPQSFLKNMWFEEEEFNCRCDDTFTKYLNKIIKL